MMNKRYIEFKDENVVLGYDYVSSKYYVISQASSVHATSTYRKKEDSILQVLLSLGVTTLPDGPEIASGESQVIPSPEDPSIEKSFPVIKSDAVNYLKNNLKNIIEEFDPPGFYTIEEDGSYIRTIQFNNWKDYPLTVDCTKGNIFIGNSNILYSLDIKEDPTIRIRHFCTFYLEKLGLHVEEKYMRGAYYFLVNQYLKPNFYNKVIRENSGLLVYDNNFVMANYNNKSPITCDGSRDPYKDNPEELDLGKIILINNTDNYIYLQDSIIQENSSYKYNLRDGLKVRISDSSFVVEGTDYSANGDYTISSIGSDGRTIFLEEPLNASVEAPKCFVQADLTPIVSMSRDDKKITVGSVPNNVIIGDTIHVTGANVTTEHEVISCDGSYTVTDITDQIQQIKDEVISTTASTKEIKLSADSTALSVGDIIELKGTSEPSNNGLVLTIVSVDTSNNVVLTVGEDIADSTGGIISCQKYLYSNIYTEEAIPTNYPNEGSSKANLYKEVFVGDIASVTSSSINLLDEPPSSSKIKEDDYLYLYDLEGGPYKCQATGEPSGTSILIKGLEDEIKFPSLSYLNPSQVIKLNITFVADYLKDFVETGEFLLDNFKECQSYMDTLWLLDYDYTGEYSNIPDLDDSIGNNLYQEIKKELAVPYRDTTGVKWYKINFKGVYSEVYKDKEND